MSLTSIDLYETDGLLLFRSKSTIFQTIDLERVIEKAENIFNFYLDFNWEFRFVGVKWVTHKIQWACNQLTCASTLFSIYLQFDKKDLSEDITFAMRNRQEWFNEKMAAVSPEIVSEVQLSADIIAEISTALGEPLIKVTE